MDNVPRLLRPLDQQLALYLRPGRNDHRYLVQLLAENAVRLRGLVFDACLHERQADLCAEARRHGAESVLDTRMMELGTQSGCSRAGIGELGWATVGHRPHGAGDFTVPNVVLAAKAVAAFVLEHGYSAVLAPTHFLQSAQNPWLDVDTRLTLELRSQLDNGGGEQIPIYYSLAIPAAQLRLPEQRELLISSLDKLPIDALWLRVHPFGTSHSGPIALRGYIEACQDFHALRVPLVAERTGTIGLALLAFGAVGGIESGITTGESFDATTLMRSRARGKAFLPKARIYLSDIGAFLNPDQARSFFENRRAKSQFACRSQQCCRRGAVDMLSDPRRHFVNARVRDVSRLSIAPSRLRRKLYMDDFLRPATDLALIASRIDPHLEPHRKRLESWRGTLGAIERDTASRNISLAPQGRRLPLRKRAATSKG